MSTYEMAVSWGLTDTAVRTLPEDWPLCIFIRRADWEGIDAERLAGGQITRGQRNDTE